MNQSLQFGYEVFVSYAHLDNIPILSERGWVTQFTELLDNLIGVYMGSKAMIWRDNLMRGDDIVPETLRMQFPNIAVMVSILSPPYLNSEWCRWEVEQFCEKAAATGGFRFQNKSRVYKVIKTPLRGRRPPAIFDDVRGYELFFKTKYDNETPRPFGLDHGPEASKKFLDGVGDVAYDIANLLELLRANVGALDSDAPASDVADLQNSRKTVDAPAGVFVYLAEPTPDLRDEHANIRRDLLGRQYKVLPEYPLPTGRDEFIAAAKADLEASDLSIHLVGREYGEGPADDNCSYTYLQNMLAAEHERQTSNFPRLIWMPKGNRPDEIHQREFVKELLNAGSSPNTDLLQTTLENFKTVVIDMIKTASERADDDGDEPPPASGARSIYIVSDKLDAESVGVLDDYLLSMGYETYLPETSGDEAAVRRDHEEKLRKADAVLVYWDTAPKLWLLTKLDDLRKVHGYGRARPLLSKAVFIAGEQSPEKERFRARDALVIRNSGGINPAALVSVLQPFVSEIDRAEEGHIRENY